MKILSFLSGDKPDCKVKRPFKNTDQAFDAEGRRWPILSAAPRNCVSKLESTIGKLSAELNLRCTQVADLYNTQQQQANEILSACDEIDHLVKAVHAHQGTIAQRETEAAAAKQKLYSAR